VAIDLVAIEASLDSVGLHVVGVFAILPDDRLIGRSAMLIANAGSSLWPCFRASREFDDGRPDPLDRWTRRTVDAIARDVGANVVYPFEGPPYRPFQQWAARADPRISASPIGLAIHPKWGLWWALRAALVFDEAVLRDAQAAPSPCTACADKPCLNRCPADAFDGGRYRMASCVDQLRRDYACCERGCLARLACPIGRKFIYQPEHAAFHMRAFVARRVGR